jgi:hypothetical protein
VPDFAEMVHHPQVLVAGIGLLLLLAGARFYRFAIVSPGFVAGVFVVRNLPDVITDMVHFPGQDWVLSLVLGGICALILNKLEVWAVRLTGAVLAGGLAHIFMPHPIWIPLVAGLAGGVVFPPFYKKMLPITTSVLGAVCITWSFESLQGPPETLYMAGALSAIGIVAQTWFFKRKKEDEEDAA